MRNTQFETIEITRPWSVQEAADFLGYSLRHTYELARTGVLPATKRGRKWFFSPQKVRSWAGMA